MKYITAKIHCSVCNRFETKHEVDVNEYGYYVYPQAFCPHCLSILICVIENEEKNG